MDDVRLAQFSRSEFGGKWGEPADQLKVKGTYETADLFDGELNIVIRSGVWKYCFRLMDRSKAEKLAAVAEATVRNPYIGYSQNNAACPRTTFYDALMAADGDPVRIKTPCNGDCSAGLAAWLTAVGIPVNKDMWTGNELETLEATGEILTLTDTYFLVYGNYLRRGDILLRDGHTAVVIDNGRDATGIPATATGDSWQRMLPAKRGLGVGIVKKGEMIIARLPVINGRWMVTEANGLTAWESKAWYEADYRYTVTAYRANIRRSASLAGEVLGTVDKFDELDSTGRTYEDQRGVWWHEVVHKQKLGWISELMVERSGNIE